MAEIRLTIDGREVKAKPGMTVLEAAQSADIYIPTLCADPDLKPYGGCRLCIVEIEKLRGFPTSCTTPVTEGMVVKTNTDAVNEVRRTVVELLLSDHPSECLICHRRERCGPFDICLRNVAVTERCVTCAKNEHCELQDIVDYLEITELPFKHTERSYPVDTSNPFFYRDLAKCVLCGKCVRVCDEVLGVGAVAVINRGFGSKVATFGDKPIIDSNCVSCGECVARCPVGALMPKVTERPTREVATTCTYCGVGCGLYLGVRDGKVMSVRGKREDTVNNGFLCVKGRFGFDFIHHQDRLKYPLIKKNGKFVEASWDEALELVATKLGGYKPDELAVISSAKCTNEDNYVAQKFARAVLKTNNVDHCARLCHAPSVAGLVQSFGSGAMTNSFGEFGDAGCIFAIGTNTTEAHPIIALELKRAVDNGARLIVANPREIDLVRWSHLWLQHNPGSDVALLMGMMRVIVDEGLLDQDFIDKRCENFDAFKVSLQNFDLNSVARITGVPKDKIAEAARIYATEKPSAILYAMGITQHSHGTDNVIATANLAMLTGNIGKPASGVNPLRGQNNVQGACDMGALPNVYPGYQAVTDAKVKSKFEAAWGGSLSPSVGMPITEIVEAAYKGKIKAMYLIGENPLLSEPDITHAEEALNKLEFLVVQDIFLSETAELADVILPGVSFAEKDGTFTNTERRVQRVRKAVEPIGKSRADWEITCQVGKKMGSSGFDFKNASQIMDEIASLTPSYGGIGYRRLEKSGLQWPCPTQEHSGTPILHTQQFTRGKGQFIPLEYKPPMELPDKQYPLVLTTGRSLYHFHTGTMTRRVEGLNVLMREGEVEINPADAAKLGIADGDKVKVASRRGEVVAKANVTEASPAGVVFMTFHFAESPANRLTNPALDPVAKIPEYKVCAVRVEKA
ncbi:MAG: formate dehydrogenase subunit alpha [Dehalococcoidia bacterium]|nr:MAG: formate dehydrogenase subunit alpha [Dehalococcoidia bacterium]